MCDPYVVVLAVFGVSALGVLAGWGLFKTVDFINETAETNRSWDRARSEAIRHDSARLRALEENYETLVEMIVNIDRPRDK